MATAQKKRAPAKASPRGAQKKKKPRATGSRGAPARKGAMTAAEQKKAQARLAAKRQKWAILLFVIAIFLVFVILIEGKSVWLFLHNLVLGLFGHSAILWPILLAYIAVILALERPIRSLSGKLWLSAVLIILVTACFYIFKAEDRAVPYFQTLGELYADGAANRGSGLFSGFVGIPLIAAFGLLGAKIVILLLIFTVLMLLTGTGLIQLFKTLTKPAEVVMKTAGEKREQRVAGQAARKVEIDIPLDGAPEGMPQHPVQAAKGKGPDPKNLENNQKFRKLKEAMGGVPDSPAASEDEEKRDDGLTPCEEAYECAVFPPRRRGEAPPEAPGNGAAPKAQPETPAAPPAEKPKTSETGQASILKEAEGENAYRYPPITLLDENLQLGAGETPGQLQENGELLVNTLQSFGVSTRILNISRGPAVTRYELQPAAGVKISKITNLADDIALNLASSGVRIEAPIPNKAAVGIEVPNKLVSMVKVRELLDSAGFVQAKSRLTVALGKDIAGNAAFADLAKMPHLLIAGATGSGKSVCINTLIVSLLYKATPDEVRLLMIDPKVVELGIYNGIPHLLVPVVTNPRKAAGALGWAVTEMLNRYQTFAEANVRDLASYNEMVEMRLREEPGQPLAKLPQIVVIIDELADLMMAAPNEVEDSICRLAQMARAAGMHLVIATQRPSVDVITGIIKANIPSRIAFAVSSQVDSRTILDMGGAEKLLGRGDMLFAPVGSSKPQRLQGCFVSDHEIERVVDFVKRAGASDYDQQVAEEIERQAAAEKAGRDDTEEEADDPMMTEAVKCVVEAGQASTSLLQRRLRLGYARAGRLIDQMEQKGIVGPHEGSKPRQVLITYQQWLEMSMNREEAPSAQEEGE